MYKDIWTPTLGEKLSMVTEPENHHNKYAVKVLIENEVVGHVPRDILKYCTSALLWGKEGGAIKCEITGKRQNKCWNGLEVPCKYTVKGPFHMILNVEKIDYLYRTTE